MPEQQPEFCRQPDHSGTPAVAPDPMPSPDPRTDQPTPEADQFAANSGNQVCSAPPVAPTEHPAPTPTPAPRSTRSSGGARPQTPEEIADFAQRWRDPFLTLEMLGRLYGCHARSIQKWSVAFKLGPRSLSGAEPRQAPEPTSPGSRRDADPKWNALDDEEIQSALAEIESDAAGIEAHTDLVPLYRKLLRLTLLVAAKTPVYSWAALYETAQRLSNIVLSARKIEAKLPTTGGDAATLRREAASQLMHEMKSVLNQDEQQRLAVLVKAAADRLMARGATSSAPS